ncbi:hypothetical protein [Comamonas thiooxydans]|uniref:hypothetical protein n=1 Tax=Comamonas thiooxydans TaxID=363952 RepID=UPI0001BB19B3|nr:hypothetical protein [Comamonas thiooxydans]ACY34561.1 hypothetical protein CtCNB1_3815 [Comamonas thiooxydans]MDO1475701.1 hypothetical protein [Comamonas thiooxydans]
MSVITAYKEPQDVFFKLLREGRRTWLAQDEKDKCDHFFNFCVTAHSLRDWCIKYLGLSGLDANLFHTEINSLNYLPECRDIANSSKHFGLDSKSSLVISAETKDSEFVPLTLNGKSDEKKKIIRTDISINLSNQKQIELFGFLHHVANNWISVLNKKGIPIDSSLHTMYMFIENA